MSTLRDFLLGTGLMAIAGLVIPFLKKKLSGGGSRSYENRAPGEAVERLLYGLFLAILLSTPAAGFMLATALDVSNRDAFVFLFMGIGVLLSLPVTLLLARLASEDQYAKYWLYLEARSNASRRAILLMWLCVTLMAFGIGVAGLFE